MLNNSAQFALWLRFYRAIARNATAGNLSGDQSVAEDKNTAKGNTMKIHYLEIVTPDVDAAVALYSKIHSVSFGVADENLGGARTAKLANGETLSIRAPMLDTETPVVRPYFLVHDIVKAVAAAAQSGAEIAMQPTEIPERGKFAILIQGGIESGLWQAWLWPFRHLTNRWRFLIK
jgi:uncharacterized protein